MFKRSSRFLPLLPLLLLPLCAVAETQYISDELAVPLRRGPSNQHRILHAGLPSGTALEILTVDDGSGFTHVRTANGTEGYVPTQYLTREPIARDRLVAAQKRVESLTAQLTELRQTMKTEQTARGSAEGTASQLDRQVKQLQTELAEIRRVSANAVATYEENKALKAQSEQLQSTLSEQAAQIKSLKSNDLQVWFLSGGALVLLGLVCGVVIKSRPKRSNGW